MKESKSELEHIEEDIQEAGRRNQELQEQLKSKRDADGLIQERLDRGERMVECLSVNVEETKEKLADLERRVARLHTDALAMAFRITVINCFHPRHRYTD